jgi:hypothetical protein
MQEVGKSSVTAFDRLASEFDIQLPRQANCGIIYVRRGLGRGPGTGL